MTTTHRYRTRCEWSGSTGEGYEEYSRTHRATTDPETVELMLSGDPAFRGDASLLNPEQMLVLAASSCQLLSFLAVAARARLDVIAYEDDAEGEMPESDPPLRITKITLRPSITLRPGPSEERVLHLVETAHRACFIANSLTSAVVVEPTIVWADGEQ